jgi:hypothetical protein
MGAGEVLTAAWEQSKLLRLRRPAQYDGDGCTPIDNFPELVPESSPNEEIVPHSSSDPDDGSLSLKGYALYRKLLSVEELLNLPPPEWLIDGVLMCDTLAVLWGKPGCRKSFVAVDWALSYATGAWWARRATKKGKSLYVAAEGGAGIGQRVDAWMRHNRIYGIGSDQFELYPGAIRLMDREWADACVEMADSEQPGLVVLDTLSRMMAGGDENASRDMGVVIDVCTRIKEKTNACVLVVHHDTRMGGNLRGHSSLDGALDTSIEAKKDNDLTILRCGKQKDAPEFEPIRLRAVAVEPSLVLKQSHEVVGLGDMDTASNRRVLDVLWDNFGTTGAAGTDLRDVCELPKSTYYRALNNLLSTGAIVNKGSEARPIFHAIRKPDDT